MSNHAGIVCAPPKSMNSATQTIHDQNVPVNYGNTDKIKNTIEHFATMKNVSYLISTRIIKDAVRNFYKEIKGE